MYAKQILKEVKDRGNVVRYNGPMTFDNILEGIKFAKLPPNDDYLMVCSEEVYDELFADNDPHATAGMYKLEPFMAIVFDGAFGKGGTTVHISIKPMEGAMLVCIDDDIVIEKSIFYESIK